MLEEVPHSGWALRFYSFFPYFLFSLLLVWMKDDQAAFCPVFPTAAAAAMAYLSLSSPLPSPWRISPLGALGSKMNPFFLQLIIIIEK